MSNQPSKWERKNPDWKIPVRTHAFIPDPTYMTIREVADLLRVSMLTIKRWGKLGKLDCIRINSRGDRRYLRSEINKLLGGKV